MTMLDFANDLDELFKAYDNLGLLAGANNCDSGNVAYVLMVLNKQFEKVVADFEGLRKPGGESVVKCQPIVNDIVVFSH